MSHKDDDVALMLLELSGTVVDCDRDILEPTSTSTSYHNHNHALTGHHQEKTKFNSDDESKNISNNKMYRETENSLYSEMNVNITSDRKNDIRSGNISNSTEMMHDDRQQKLKAASTSIEGQFDDAIDEEEEWNRVEHANTHTVKFSPQPSNISASQSYYSMNIDSNNNCNVNNNNDSPHSKNNSIDGNESRNRKKYNNNSINNKQAKDCININHHLTQHHHLLGIQPSVLQTKAKDSVLYKNSLAEASSTSNYFTSSDRYSKEKPFAEAGAHVAMAAAAAAVAATMVSTGAATSSAPTKSFPYHTHTHPHQLPYSSSHQFPFSSAASVFHQLLNHHHDAQRKQLEQQEQKQMHNHYKQDPQQDQKEQNISDHHNVEHQSQQKFSHSPTLEKQDKLKQHQKQPFHSVYHDMDHHRHHSLLNYQHSHLHVQHLQNSALSLSNNPDSHNNRESVNCNALRTTSNIIETASASVAESVSSNSSLNPLFLLPSSRKPEQARQETIQENKKNNIINSNKNIDTRKINCNYADSATSGAAISTKTFMPSSKKYKKKRKRDKSHIAEEIITGSDIGDFRRGGIINHPSNYLIPNNDSAATSNSRKMSSNNKSSSITTKKKTEICASNCDRFIDNDTDEHEASISVKELLDTIPKINPDIKTRKNPVHDREIVSVDVLLGRGGMTNHHIGNIHFRNLVSYYRRSYCTAPKGMKGQLAKNLCKYVRLCKGRFLQKLDNDKSNFSQNNCSNLNNSVWYECGDTRAHAKCGQALREGTAALIRQVMSQENEKFTTNIEDTSAAAESSSASVRIHIPQSIVPSSSYDATTNNSNTPSPCPKEEQNINDDNVNNNESKEKHKLVANEEHHHQSKGGALLYV